MNKIRLFLISILSCIKLIHANKIEAISDFKSDKYLGTWYEFARLPNSFERKCTLPITASYSINPENHDQIIVTNQCNTKNGSPKVATGVAYLSKESNLGKLKVNFLPKFLRWLSFGYANYWILYTDYDNIAIVATPNKKYLWILTRSNNLDVNIFNKAILIIKDNGFNIDDIIFNYKINQ